MLISFLKQFNIDFCAVCDNNITDIVFLMPYYPFENYDKNCARIDSFYIASNSLYKKVKVIEKKAIESGFEIVKRPLHLKKIAQKGGLGSVLDNMLLANKNYGTKVTLQGFSVKGQFEYITDGIVNKICDSCHRCDIACPNNALCKGEFTREKCIRHKQDFAKEYYSIVGSRVLGCEECQNVCPYNSHIEKIKMPDKVAEIFDIQNVFNMIKCGKRGMAPLSDLIGSNMARPTFIFNLVINSLIASNNYEYTDIIKSFVNSNNEDIKAKVQFYLDCVNKIK